MTSHKPGSILLRSPSATLNSSALPQFGTMNYVLSRHDSAARLGHPVTLVRGVAEAGGARLHTQVSVGS